MDKFTFIGNADVNAIDDLYKRYQKDPSSIDQDWVKFFEGFDFAKTDFDSGEIPENFQKEFKVINLINAYRNRGHLFTKTNPVRERRTYTPNLDIENFGLTTVDLSTNFQAGEQIGIGTTTLDKIIEHLKLTYCQSIGIEFVYMRDPERLEWFRNSIELANRPIYSADEKIGILKKLNQAAGFEQFLQKKYVGQKRFSIEGAEALIPALDKIISKGAEVGIEEVIVGMAHRGRLNTLINIFQKEAKDVFCEFDGKEFDEEDEDFDGDVKYHLGFSKDIVTDTGKKVHLTLSPNPSHLEAVDPVVQGMARARIDQVLHDENKIVPILIHGDAAVAGQGVVYEVTQMAQLDGYRTGGTIHIVVNNQVGFTTNYVDARSSTYCTDVFKTTLCPVFHVNGDDIEAVIQVMEIALAYRQKFNRDVVIDLLCYRKYGHNEGDEPKFTQPKLYKAIASHPNPKDIYLKTLLAEGILNQAEADAIDQEIYNKLDVDYSAAKEMKKATVRNFLSEIWKGYRHGTVADFESEVDTSVPLAELKKIADKVASLPEGKNYFRKIKKLFNDRKTMLKDDRLDWGLAENIAYASLLVEKHPVRVSGQDVERGTFSHRHAVVKTEDTEEEIIPLNLISKDQAKFTIYNSLLSEYAVLGFEYGYSLVTPNALTIWEAQFGDFYNGAQIMVDQFITAGEDKWKVQSGLTLLLPHGYEGQGGEHSSGRLERFLQATAELNIQICNTTTPANHFHLLRRQMKREFRKPLVVFSPKNLLRHPDATSKLEDLATGEFMPVIDDVTADPNTVDTIVLCSGKFYYEIKAEAAERGVKNATFIRLEQLYPLPKKQLDATMSRYPKAKKYIWAQEEPYNMGAAMHIYMRMKRDEFKIIARKASAAPATGSSQTHKKRLAALYNTLFDAISK
ncbi:2-oxoglutarate dehydrogenase E1 component [Putridiphycobacter roseus]|uniref:oxoglutarate dehydrogenase (succinyl-transferring) n=1 Tax=Putridiphycobacter roseus TaxID=2219161 RepID=A0A2W1MYF2_9FLAO|nr:2-oxoglutarate dehydrogenase E1 component [Putridiphycobacter roseus]PZE16887.1 2-oxoglutarate dehydrogenase E1 component [Putridiphycobacter roseus]